jgi:protocatechuate 3,4-dioxygenase beta subunit
MKNARIAEVLSEIENSSEFFFFFNEKFVNVDRKVDVSVKNVKIDEILNDLFKNTDVNFKVIDKQIILTTLKGENSVSQQVGRIITGKVSDQNGSPLPGATVIVVYDELPQAI